MALYQVVYERLRLSAHRLAAGSGGVAGPEATDEEKAKDAKGAVEHIRFPLMRGYLVYTEKGDFEGLSETHKAHAFFAHNTEEVERYASLGALEEVDASDLEEPNTDPRSFGLLGEDNGTDLDAAHGEEIRAAEAASAADEQEEDTAEAQEDSGDTGGTGKAKK